MNSAQVSLRIASVGASLAAGTPGVRSALSPANGVHKLEHVGAYAGEPNCSINSWMDCRQLRRTLRPELLAESRKHKSCETAAPDSLYRPIRAARLLALRQTRSGP